MWLLLWRKITDKQQKSWFFYFIFFGKISRCLHLNLTSLAELRDPAGERKERRENLVSAHKPLVCLQMSLCGLNTERFTHLSVSVWLVLLLGFFWWKSEILVPGRGPLSAAHTRWFWWNLLAVFSCTGVETPALLQGWRAAQLHAHGVCREADVKPPIPWAAS